MEQKIYFVTLAELDIDGSLYDGLTNDSDQPRYGSEQCITCESGTWPDPDGQRLAISLIENYLVFF